MSEKALYERSYVFEYKLRKLTDLSLQPYLLLSSIVMWKPSNALE